MNSLCIVVTDNKHGYLQITSLPNYRTCSLPTLQSPPDLLADPLRLGGLSTSVTSLTLLQITLSSVVSGVKVGWRSGCTGGVALASCSGVSLTSGRANGDGLTSGGRVSLTGGVSLTGRVALTSTGVAGTVGVLTSSGSDGGGVGVLVTSVLDGIRVVSTSNSGVGWVEQVEGW